MEEKGRLLCAQCIVKDISYTEFGLVSFYGGIQSSKTFFVSVVRLVKYALRETRHVLKEGMGINVTNKFIRNK